MPALSSLSASAFIPVVLLPLILTPTIPGARPPVPRAPGPAPAAVSPPSRPLRTPAQLVEPPTPVGSWAWPLSPRPPVARMFSIGPDPWSPGHRGVDLSSAPGATVLAPANGTIRLARTIAGRGVLTIDHGDGLISSFEPVTATSPPGTAVRRGQAVADLDPPPSGETHCSPGVCLHWGVRLDGQYVDPLRFLADRGPAVLLPLGAP